MFLQGLIQGPGEFAEGLAIGARSLFGHTVGKSTVKSLLLRKQVLAKLGYFYLVSVSGSLRGRMANREYEITEPGWLRLETSARKFDVENKEKISSLTLSLSPLFVVSVNTYV